MQIYRQGWVWCLIIIALLLLSLCSIALGPVVIPLHDILAIFGLSTPASLPEQLDITHTIIMELRLPRVVLAIIVGAGLAITGGMLQTVTRNALADPFLFGLSSGAAAGAVFIIVHYGEILGRWSMPLASFVGGIIAALVVSCLYMAQRHKSMEKLVISGLAVSFLFGALTNYLIFSGDQHTANSVLFWSLGGLGRAAWDNLIIAAAGLLLLIVLWLSQHLSMDALLAGEETAESLGIPIRQLRIAIFMVCALATASFVSLTGIVGFVGLMVPHLARPLVGVRHAVFLPICGGLGAVLLLAGDLACRLLVAPQELPLGIVTASIGGLFVLVLIFKSDRNQ